LTSKRRGKIHKKNPNCGSWAKAAKIGKDYRISRQDFEAYYRQQGGGSLFGEETGLEASQDDKS
jgi:hypothetical protein